MERISKDLIGASTIPIILSILMQNDSYGYEIMKSVKDISLGRIEWKEGSLYPVLKKLEKEKKIKSYWKVRKSQRPRKYYTILETGKTALTKEKEEWELMQGILSSLWNTQTDLT